MESPSQQAHVGALGAGVSPEALDVNISAQGGGHVAAPTVSHSTVQGNINNISHHHLHYHGTGDSARATPTQEVDQSWMVPTYKEWICSKYKRVQEYNSLPAEDALLTDRYTEPLIVNRHRQKKESEDEICFRGSSFFSAREAYQSTTVDQFFKPDSYGEVPKAVIFQGHSGHGKSFTVQKIMYDWASGNLYQDRFDLMLHLRCKELNHVSGERCIVDLVSSGETYPMILQILKNSPGKVLFLIDGFDELQFPMDEISTSPVKDLLTPAPIEAILSALLKGLILFDCFLLVTTRSTAADKLSKLLKRPQRSTEILGFSEKGVQEYFQRFCQDKQVSEEAFSCVKANETLFTSCFIPVICWIVCTVFRERMKENAEMTGELETTTSIFVNFVSTLLEHHCQGLSQPVPTLLKSLGQLAEKGILEKQVLLEKESVLSKISDPASVPFLCKFLLKKKVRKKEMFSFMHLSFQEFFTALYYTLDQNEEKVKELLRSIHGNETQSHLLPVIQFLFGVSNREVMQDLKDLQLPYSSSIRSQLEEWILGLIKGNSDAKKADETLFILRCLYELHEGKPCEDNCDEKPFVSRAMEAWGEIKLDSISLTSTDCWMLLYCLQCWPAIRSLELTSCNITAEKLRMLKPALSRCEKLGLDVDDLLDDDVGDLIAAIGEGKILQSLRVKSPLSDDSVQQVLGSLFKQTSVGEVWFRVETITFTTAEILREHIKNTQDTNSVWLHGASGADTLCSFLTLERRGKYFWVWIFNNEDSSPELETSGQTLTLVLPSLISDIMLREILQIFHQMRHTAENTPEYDECTSALVASLASLPDPRKITLGSGYLTKIWANRILSLIHNCPQMKEVQFLAEMWTDNGQREGLVLEEGVRILQEAQRSPGCTIILSGKRCCKPVNWCTELKDCQLCNQYTEIRMKGKTISEKQRTHSLTQEEQMELKLTVTDMSDADVDHLVKALGEGNILNRLYVSSSSLSDESVDQVLSALSKQKSVGEVKLFMNSITISTAERLLQLLNTETGQSVGLVLSKGAIRAESFCSGLTVKRVGKYFWLGMCHYGDSSPESNTSGFVLALNLSSEISSIMLREILHVFHQLRYLPENTPEYDERIGALVAFLASLPNLLKVILGSGCLTKIWANRILSLIHTCPHLDEVQFDAVIYDESGDAEEGLLLDEGVCLLQEAQTRPDCLITLQGLRCCKASKQCSELKDRNLRCNKQVEVKMKGPLHGNEDKTEEKTKQRVQRPIGTRQDSAVENSPRRKKRKPPHCKIG